MKNLTSTFAVLLLVSLVASADEAQKVSCSFKELSTTLNRFATDLVVQKQDDGKVSAQFVATTAFSGVEEATSSDAVEVGGSVTSYKPGDFAVGPVNIYELRSNDGLVNLSIVQGVNGPFSTLSYKDGPQFKSSCK